MTRTTKLTKKIFCALIQWKAYSDIDPCVCSGTDGLHAYWHKICKDDKPNLIRSQWEEEILSWLIIKAFFSPLGNIFVTVIQTISIITTCRINNKLLV